MKKRVSKREIADLISEIYDALPTCWTAKEGNLAFNGYVRHVQQILYAKERYLGTRVERGTLRFLDVGMSMGVVACAAARLDMSVSGCDYLKNRVHAVLAPIREKFGIAYADYDATTDDLPYGDNEFDIVNCNDMIEHLHTSPKRMLLEVLRVLTPGGVFIITNPNIAALHNRIQLLFGGSIHASIEDWYHNPHWARPKFSGHVREYSPRELRYVLGQAGFKNIRTSTEFTLGGSKRPATPDDAQLDYSGGFSYLKDAPFYSRKFRVRSLYDMALLAFYVATLPLPGARLSAFAFGQK